MLTLRPIGFRAACEFIRDIHEHNKPPRGAKFCVSVLRGDSLVGVATAGRPVARAYDDGLTLEINRTCTLRAGKIARNANSMLYGALRRAAWAVGYLRVITYTQEGESGASVRGAGFVLVKELPPRKNWADSSKKLVHMRDGDEPSGVKRYLWECRRG